MFRGMSIALDIAEGLSYLHSGGVVHLDLKSPNVLLTADHTAKIADVGLARMLGSKTHMSQTMPGGETDRCLDRVSASAELQHAALISKAGLALKWRCLPCCLQESVTAVLQRSSAVSGFRAQNLHDRLEIPW